MSLHHQDVPQDNSLAVIKLGGTTPYAVAHRLQLDLVARRIGGEVTDTLLLLEHAPVVTLGRAATDAGVLLSEPLLRERGIELHRVERGGLVTYHGPGQLVGYPIMELAGRKMGVADFVHRLEQVMIAVLEAFAVRAFTLTGKIGVFTERGKIGAVGVAVRHGVTFHGFCLNIDPDLTPYRWIVPCGMRDMPATSLRIEAGEAPIMDEVKEVAVSALSTIFTIPSSMMIIREDML